MLEMRFLDDEWEKKRVYVFSILPWFAIMQHPDEKDEEWIPRLINFVNEQYEILKRKEKK